MLLSREVHSFLRTVGNTSKFSFLKNVDVKNFYTCANYAAQVSFKLSDIGEGIREVTVKEWFVKVGDKVSQFDEICEVQSDKASVTITSRYDGIIKKLHYKIDEIALVGKPLVDIDTDNAEETLTEQITKNDVDKVITTEETRRIDTENAITVEQKIITEVVRNPEILCIPSVRRLAKEYKVDLSEIKGSGKDGRILKEDVLRHLQLIEEKIPSIQISSQDRTEPIKGFQKAMVKTMTESLKIPHFVYSDEIAITNLTQMRQTLRTLPDSQDLKLTYMPFFIKAASNALHKFPILNATLDEKCENVTYKSQHNIGIAMDTKVGLAVPVIKNVERLSILEINSELNRLVKSGRNGTFSTQDLSGVTFTISNIGAIGGTYMKPIIMSPQVAIIALGTSQLLPRFDENKNVVPVEIMNVSGAADHRIVDGATMARFVQSLKKQIQNPYLLFLNLA